MKQIPIVKNENVPSLEFFNKSFEQLKSFDDQDYEKIIEHYSECFTIYPLIPLVYSKGNDELVLFRGISEEDLNNCKLDRNAYGSFSYPPSQSSRDQRFNIHNKPLFYASNNPHTYFII